MSEINPYEYNGWTNYQTWRVYQEIIVAREWTEEDLEKIKEDVSVLERYIDALVEKVVFEEYEEAVIKGKAGGNFGLMEDYAKAFLDNVNYREIAEAIKEDNP